MTDDKARTYNLPLASPISPARLHEIYSRTAAFYDEVVAAHQARAKELAIELLDRAPGERFLEVGIGTAWAFERVIGASGANLTVGVDAAEGMLTVARDRLGTNAAIADLALADARALPFADGAFDCLLCTYTLEVLPESDIALVLAEMLRVLRPAGRAVIVDLTEGEGDDDAAFTDDWQRRYLKDPEYFGGARPLRLAPLIESAGFKLTARRYSGHGQSWPSEVVLATKPNKMRRRGRALSESDLPLSVDGEGE